MYENKDFMLLKTLNNWQRNQESGDSRRTANIFEKTNKPKRREQRGTEGSTSWYTGGPWGRPCCFYSEPLTKGTMSSSMLESAFRQNIYVYQILDCSLFAFILFCIFSPWWVGDLTHFVYIFPRLADKRAKCFLPQFWVIPSAWPEVTSTI